MSPADRSSGRDFGPARPNCSPRAFGTSLFFAGTCHPGPAARAPKDGFLLAVAKPTQADFLVTGDKELLSLKHYKSTRIITPAAMIEILKEAESGKSPCNP